MYKLVSYIFSTYPPFMLNAFDTTDFCTFWKENTISQYRISIHYVLFNILHLAQVSLNVCLFGNGLLVVAVSIDL